MTAPNWDVAVIGAGVTGVALIIHLAPRLPAGSRILVIGSPGETGLGLAYGTTCPDHLLNVRASRLSILHDDADHFVDWLSARRESKGLARRSLEEAYLPRYLFGEYVQHTFARALEDARRRCVVELVEGTAVSARPSEVGVDIRLASGQRFRAAVAVLCLGHPATAIPDERGDDRAGGTRADDRRPLARLPDVDDRAGRQGSLPWNRPHHGRPSPLAEECGAQRAR